MKRIKKVLVIVVLILVSAAAFIGGDELYTRVQFEREYNQLVKAGFIVEEKDCDRVDIVTKKYVDTKKGVEYTVPDGNSFSGEFNYYENHKTSYPNKNDIYVEWCGNGHSFAKLIGAA